MQTTHGVRLGADLCDVRLARDPAVRCQLRVGHGGRHVHRTRTDGAVVITRWGDPPGVCVGGDVSGSAAR